MYVKPVFQDHVTCIVSQTRQRNTQTSVDDFYFVCNKNCPKSGSGRLNSFEAKVSVAERLSRRLSPMEKENGVSSYLSQKCKNVAFN